MAGISPTFFWCALQVTLFLTVALPLYLLVRRRDPRVGAATGASVLGIVILLSGLAASPWPRWSLERFNRPATSAVANHALASSRGATASSETGESALSAAAPIVTPQEGLQEYLLRLVQAGEASPSSPAANASGAGSSWMTWIAVILASGIVGGAVHLAASLISVRRLIQRSRPLDDLGLTTEFAGLRRQLGVAREVTLRESTELATPATVGTFCPVILLPATWQTWSTTERRAVLAHELAHIAQHDFAAWVVARAAVAIHFYHPLVRWFAGRLQLDQELAADAAAARLLGDRQEYLQSLASLALATPAHRVAGPARTFIPGRSLLVRRVEMLRTAEVAPSRLSRVVRVARAACLIGLLIAAATAVGIRPRMAPAGETEGTSAVRADALIPQPNRAESAPSLVSDENKPAFTNVSGSVVDATGAPVPHALVVCGRDPSHGGDVEIVADEQGRFSFKLTHPIDRREVLDTWAYAKGHAFRTVNLRTLNVMAPAVENVLIMLPPPERISFEVNLPSIEPAVGVMVAPRLVSVPNGFYSADEPTGLSAWVPKRLAAVLSAPVGEDGMVSFDAIPRKLAESFRIETPEYGIQEFSQFEDEVRLAPAGRVEGRIETSKPEDLAGRTVYVESGPTDRRYPKLTRIGNAQTVIDETGRFVVPAIIEGRLRVRIDWPEQSRMRPVLVTERPQVDAGSTLELVIREEPAAVVKGRLVAGEERRPADGAMLSIRNAGSIDFGAHVESDADGKFEAKVIAGEALVQVYVHGKIVGDDRQFDYPPIKQLKIPEGVEEFQLDDIVLQPQIILAGELLRRDGSPGRTVSVGLRRGDSFRHLSGRTITDEDGKFRMPVSNWRLRDERLPEAANEWLLLSQPDSPQETPTRTPLKVVSEEPLVLQEP